MLRLLPGYFFVKANFACASFKGERNLTRRITSIRSKAQEIMYGQTDNVSFRLFSVPFIPLNARGEVISRKRNCINGNQIYMQTGI